MLLLLSAPLAIYSQGAPQGGGAGEAGGVGGDSQSQRTFEIIVREDPSMTNTRGITWDQQVRGLRGVGADMFSLYRSTVAGKFSSISTSLISAGINFLYDKLSSHRQDWMQAVQKECTYTKKLSMLTEVVDFYKNPSTKGALDPSDIVFTGFGCRQTICKPKTQTSEAGKGEQREGGAPQGGKSPGEDMAAGGTPNQGGQAGADMDTIPVFYVYCSLRTDSVGKQRIIHHSKFEVEVEDIYFNPYACNLPNDSTAGGTSHIDFNFDRRNNLTFTLTANISSSWMNEAIQVYRDIPLGEFKVTANIDKKDLNDKGVFIYSRKRDKGTEKEKKVRVEGESFLVPRSYIGTLDTVSYASAWGTGQYKIDMEVSETCSINQDYYMDKDSTNQHAQNMAAMSQKKKSKKNQQKWNNNWKEEWKIIKKRQRSSSLWDTVKETVVSEWKGNEWITTIIEPASSTMISSLSNYIGDDTSTNMGGGGNTMGGSDQGGNATGMPPM